LAVKVVEDDRSSGFSEVSAAKAQHGQKQWMILKSVAGLITSGFWIDGFIETACLRVIAIAVTSFLSSLRFKTPLENRKKRIQIYTVVFSLK